MGQRINDRMRNFGGGSDNYRPADELEPNQVQNLVNMLVLDNYSARTRYGADQLGAASPGQPNLIPGGSIYNLGPGTEYAQQLLPNTTYVITGGANEASFETDNFITVPLTPGVPVTFTTLGAGSFSLVATGGVNLPVTAVLQTASETGNPIQCLFYFNNPSLSYILMGQGGHLYTWNGVAWSTALSFSLANGNVQPAIAQGVDKVLISDGVSHLQVWDGVTFADCGPGTQLNPPPGCTILCWSGGRMMATGLATAPDTIFVSNLLAYGPGEWNTGTQSFRIGDGDGQAIVALAPMQNFLVAVLKENSVWLMNMDPSLPISNWQAQPQGDLVGAGIGCVGKNAWCLYENDVLFMSQDGVQSLQRMQAAAGQYELTSPLSLPIQPLIDRINWSVAYLIKAEKYRQLALFYVPLDNSTFNNYVLVWNGRLGRWTGYFTGWEPSCSCVTRFNRTLQLVIGNEDGSVNLWKDAADLKELDSTYTDNGVSIPWELDTRAFVFGNFDDLKKPRGVLTRFNEGNATVNFSLFEDLSDTDDWTNAVAPSGSVLPVILPVVLASFKPTNVYRSVEGDDYFNEAYLKISGQSGWCEIRNITMTAFRRPYRDPNA